MQETACLGAKARWDVMPFEPQGKVLTASA
jgi:hypothetical protein